MDRRLVSGMVGLVVACSFVDKVDAWPPEPGDQRPIGYEPIQAIDRSINAGTAPASAPAAGVQPPTPDSSGPVSMTPVPPIGRSINAGKDGEEAPRFGLSSIFRKPRPRSAATAVGRVTPAQAAPPIAPSWTPSKAEPSDATGRPAPFAGQVPAGARPQADPTTDPASTEGRPAPMADDRPGRARPRALANDRPLGPRPTATGSSPAVARPRPPAEEPNTATPAIPSTLPPLEAEPPPPVGSDPMAGMPPVEPVVAARPPAPEPIESTPPPRVLPAATADPQVSQAGGESTAIRLKEDPPKKTLSAGRRAASVGDEIITLHELNLLVLGKYEELMQSGQIPPGREKDALNQLAAQALDGLIEQAVILQEAKRVMGKNPKNQQQFTDFITKKWKDEELPQMLKKLNVSNEFELKKILESQGRNYEDMRESYRKMMMAREFQMIKIHDKVSADLSEQKAFYLEHLKEFEQPARFSFREIEIKVGGKFPDRAAARNQAEALKARLAREDFAAVARSDSEGPTAKEGGLYADMAPGGYGIPSVNDELNRLPVGKISGVIEAPSSFHIVRVESRREAGPLRFDEVQPKVHEAVIERNFVKARDEFVASLRAKTLIRTMFDNTESDPNLMRRKVDPAVRAASVR